MLIDTGKGRPGCMKDTPDVAGAVTKDVKSVSEGEGRPLCLHQ